MTTFAVSPLRSNSIAYLHRLKQSIQIDPPYQRQGEIWSRSKQQLLIDSVINQFDIPKIYFHEHLVPLELDGSRIKYSIVDGRQRLEAIWDFLEDKFPLSQDFKHIESNSEEAAGKRFSELQSSFPDIASLLSATSLDVMLIRTDDIELIEEMFSRLNEAVPLNAAEKRNGRGGPLRSIVRSVCSHDFFIDRIPFGNSRFRHFDLATKFLLWTDRNGPSDVKKRQLDEFWDRMREKENGESDAEALQARVTPVLDDLASVFIGEDFLLRNIGMISVYFLLFQRLRTDGAALPTRDQLVKFHTARNLPRFDSEDELNRNQRDLLEFDRLAQSPNDETALTFRLRVLNRYLEDPSAFG